MKRLPISLWLLSATVVVAGGWSLAGAKELDVWVFELLPGIVGVIGLVVLSRHFTFSAMTCVVISVSFVLIATGARYTYAEMPLFNWLRDEFGSDRNHFDRVGHFFQGLTVGLMAREVILRKTDVGRTWGVRVLSVALALSFSALYELVEWWIVLLFYPQEGAAWLGLQGDPWDAQWDMSLALAGSLIAVLPLARLHDASIRRRLEQSAPPQETAL
jgi:putative membrane protein